MNPADVKKMVDAHKVQREREKVLLAQAKRETDLAWEEYEASIRPKVPDLQF